MLKLIEEDPSNSAMLCNESKTVANIIDQHTKLTEIEFGSKVFFEPHQWDNVVVPLNSHSEIQGYLRLGWKINPAKFGYYARSPEACICDLSDPFLYGKSIVEYFALMQIIFEFKFENLLLNKIQQYSLCCFPGLQVSELDSSCSSVHFRIAGSDKRVKELIKHFRHNLTQSKRYLSLCRFLKQNNIDGPGLHELNIDEVTDREIKNFVKEVIDLYRLRNRIIKVSKCRPILFPENYDKYVFVLSGGLKYALGALMNGMQRSKIVLIEAHSAITFNKNIEFIYGSLDAFDKILIIDECYSGATLDIVFNYLKKDFRKSFTMALFPKSLDQIRKFDLAYVGNTVFNCEDLLPDLESYSKDTPLRFFNKVIDGF